MKRALLILLALVLLPTGAHALVYDASVTPDVIYGSGNSNVGWTIDSQNGVELGLRAKARYVGVTGSNGDGTYSYDAGFSSGTAAIWNYDFHINVSGTNSYLDGFNYLLNVDVDPTAGVTWYTVNPLSAFYDNEWGTDATANGDGVMGTAELASDNTVVQNSRNMGWDVFGFDPTLDGLYDFQLSVLDLTGTLLAQTSMQVFVGDFQPVPEPSTFMLMALGGLATLAIRRRMSN